MKTSLYQKNLIQQFLQTTDKKSMQELLQSLLTPQELETISKRLEILNLLKKGVAQREIAKKLNVGIATITRGSIELKRNQSKHV